MIITNDGSFSKRAMDPKFKTSKTYEAEVKPKIDAKDINALESGITIKLEKDNREVPYDTRPATARLISHKSDRSVVEVMISEGKKRQVRKMFETLGYEITSLKRTAIGKLLLGNLAHGKFKEIQKSEIYKKVLGADE